MTKDSTVPVFGTEQIRRARYAVAAVFAVHGAVTGSFATRVPWIQDHASVSAGQLGLALAFPVRLIVRAEDAELARELLDTPASAPSDAEGDPPAD